MNLGCMEIKRFVNSLPAHAVFPYVKQWSQTQYMLVFITASVLNYIVNSIIYFRYGHNLYKIKCVICVVKITTFAYILCFNAVNAYG